MPPDLVLPYYSDAIPARLPTIAEIQDGTNIGGTSARQKVVLVNQHYVVKFGNGVDLMEGQNMMFVQTCTSVQIPKVYALFEESGERFIVMERLTGKTLLELWPELQMGEKASILAQLRGYFDQLRALPSPGYYGSIGERPLLDGVFWTADPRPAINGPFSNESTFIEALALKHMYNSNPSFRVDFLRQCLPSVLTGYRPVFTHGDFQRKNILVQLSDTNADPKVYMLDWETSGWYPEYWEYGLAVWALRWDDDWSLWIQKALDPYIAASAWLQTVRLELWS